MQSESENIDYLYDFIYVDTRKISSYISQIDPTGTITAIKEVIGESDSLDTSGELNIKIFKSALRGVGTNSQSLERQFDATPTLPWVLLHKLKEQGYLSDNLETTPPGRMVLLKGNLGIIDLRLLKDVWKPNSEVMKIEAENYINEQKISGKFSDESYLQAKQEHEKRTKHDSAIVSMIEKLPHTVNITFSTDQGKCWSATSGSHFLQDPEELILKHGENISGSWYMASIIDAKPENKPGTLSDDNLERFGDLIKRSTKYIYHHFGRPSNHYAVTPIAIYRAVERPK